MTALVAAVVVNIIGGRAVPPPPRIRLALVFEGQPLPARIQAVATTEVRRVWAAYGVNIDEVGPDDSGPDGAVRLVVAVAGRRCARSTSDALGSIVFVGDSPE